MIYKKTFWMNVFFAIAWVLFCLLSFATDIDYVEYTATYKLISTFIQLFILVVPIITAILLCKPKKPLLRKFALLGNYCCSIGIIALILRIIYEQPSAVVSTELLFVFLFYFLFIIPFVINLKAIKSI